MKHWIQSITGINLIIALIALNILLAWGGSWGIDLTRDKIYSLSSASKKAVGEIDDVMTIKVFMTADLPNEIKPAAGKLRTTLREIQRLNNSKIKVQYLDPNKDERGREEAEGLGIQPLQFSSVKSDKFEISNGYFGIAVIYGDKQEVLPVASDVGNLEYFLISGIKRLRNNKQPIVLIDDEGKGQSLQILNRYAGQIYDVRHISLGSSEPLDQEASTLVLIGAGRQLNKEAGDKIRDWLKQQKGIIVFEDRVEVNESNGGIAKPAGIIDEILKENGIEVEGKLVLDEVSGIANLRTSGGVFPIRYPYWILVDGKNVNHNIPAMSGVNSLMLPWTSPIKMGGGVVSLFTSSEATAVNDEMSDLSPVGKQVELKGGDKVALGAIKTEGVKLAVVGNSRMLLDQYLGNSPSNLSLILNLIDYFSQDESLLSIRGKMLTVSPIRPIGDNLKTIIRAANIIFPLAALGLLAIGNSFWRKKYNQNDY